MISSFNDSPDTQARQGHTLPVRSLHVSRCTYNQAREAVLSWHYTRSMPTGVMIHYAIYHQQKFWGAIVFGNGACPFMGHRYGVNHKNVYELARVALKRGHPFSVSQAIAVAIRLIKKEIPRLELLMSYADTKAGHLGTIYMATNWIYLGKRPSVMFFVEGRLTHSRNLWERLERLKLRYPKKMSTIELARKFISTDARQVSLPGKHKYAYAYGRKLRNELKKDSLPYPRLKISVPWDRFSLASAPRMPCRAKKP